LRSGHTWDQRGGPDDEKEGRVGGCSLTCLSFCFWIGMEFLEYCICRPVFYWLRQNCASISDLSSQPPWTWRSPYRLQCIQYCPCSSHHHSNGHGGRQPTSLKTCPFPSDSKDAHQSLGVCISAPWSDLAASIVPRVRRQEPPMSSHLPLPSCSWRQPRNFPSPQGEVWRTGFEAGKT